MKLTKYEALEREYLRQQTPEGKAAIKVKREMLKRFENIDGKHRQVGVIQPLIDTRTGKVMQYFVVE